MTVSDLPPRAEVVDALRLVVLPAVAAAAGVYGLFALILSRLTPRWREWMPTVAVLALLAAVLVGNYFRGAFPWWPDGRWWHRVGPAVAVALVAEAFVRVVGASQFGTTFLRVGTAITVALTVIPPDQRDGPVYPLLVGLLLAAMWMLLSLTAWADGGRLVTAGMCFIALGGSAVLLHHKTIGFSDTLTVVGVTLGVLLIAGLLTRTDPSAAAAVAVAPLVAMLALGRALADSAVPDWVFLLVVGLPLLLCLRALRWFDGGRLPLRLLGLIAAGVAVAVVAAMQYEPLRFGDDW